MSLISNRLASAYRSRPWVLLRLASLLTLALIPPSRAMAQGGNGPSLPEGIQQLLGQDSRPQLGNSPAGRNSPILERAFNAAVQFQSAQAEGGKVFRLGATPEEARELIQLGIDHITGYRPPENIEAVAVAVDRFSRQTQQAIQAAAPDTAVEPNGLLGASPPRRTDRLFDWRQYQVVSTVRDQGQNRACWAFATLGAFEATYARRNRVRINMSEQDIINCNSLGYTAAGGGDFAFAYLREKGAIRERELRYLGIDSSCSERSPSSLRASNFNYVSPGRPRSPQVDEIKQALIDHGPIFCGIYSDLDLPDLPANSTFVGRNPTQPNHAVVIVGWDDDRAGGAWAIKNSWGPKWAKNGFGYVAYNANSVGFGAAWVEPLVVQSTNSDLFGAQFNAIRTIPTPALPEVKENAPAPGGGAVFPPGPGQNAQRPVKDGDDDEDVYLESTTVTPKAAAPPVETAPAPKAAAPPAETAPAPKADAPPAETPRYTSPGPRTAKSPKG